MRRSLGTAVFRGMIGVTIFGIFLTLVFFFVLLWLGGRGAQPRPVTEGAADGRDGDGRSLSAAFTALPRPEAVARAQGQAAGHGGPPNGPPAQGRPQ
jgi:hypothetical protein